MFNICILGLNSEFRQEALVMFWQSPEPSAQQSAGATQCCASVTIARCCQCQFKLSPWKTQSKVKSKRTPHPHKKSQWIMGSGQERDESCVKTNRCAVIRRNSVLLCKQEDQGGGGGRERKTPLL